jgi:hypothetical protein
MGIHEVYSSWLAEKILNFNSDLYLSIKRIFGRMLQTMQNNYFIEIKSTLFKLFFYIKINFNNNLIND